MTLVAVELRCGDRRNPLAVAEAAPELSFQVAVMDGVPGPAACASAWEVEVFRARAVPREGDPDGLEWLWSSGRSAGSRTHGLRYGGPALEPGVAACWRARVWDADGVLGPWSELARWEAGPGGFERWEASWIAAPDPRAGERVRDRERYGDDPAPQLRTEFTLDAEPVRARLHVVGLGWGEAWINGQRVGDAVLDPAWTPYRKRVLFATHDVTALLARGPNALGVLLGKGWYDPLPMRLWGYLDLREHLECGRPRLLARLVCDLADGTRRVVTSGPGWSAGSGALRRDNVYLGEVVDARQATRGWSRAGFDDRAGTPAVVVDGPPGVLEPQAQPPVRVLRELRPRAFTRGPNGEHLVDFGENFSGWVRVRVRGARGTRVRLRFGELLEPDGSLNLATSVCGKLRPGGDSGGLGAPELACQEDVYLLAGDGEELFEPRFTFHAFRYVEVTGWPGEEIDGDALVGCRISADLEEAGTFACSSPRLEAIERVARRTFRNNLIGVQSDCPHRERFGYGGDLVACAEALAFCYDMSRFYAKVACDYADEARRNGGLPETAPDVGIDHGGIEPRVGPVEWGTALPHLVDLRVRFYGPRPEEELHVDAVLAWVRFLAERAPDGVLPSGLSDWEALEERPHEVTGTAFLYESARLGSEIARAAGRDPGPCIALMQRARAAFEERFVDPATGLVAPGNQISQAHGVALGLVPEGLRERAFELLLAMVEHRSGHFTTGFFGTRLLFDALTAHGRSDVALRAVDRGDFPGYGYMLERGATTLWEQWPWDDRESSHDHPALGSVVAWLYRGLAGIHPEGASAGEILLRPQIDCGLDSVSARHRTVRGWVEVAWRRTDANVVIEVVLPANLRARLGLPPGAQPRDAQPRDVLEAPLAPGPHVVHVTLPEAESTSL